MSSKKTGKKENIHTHTYKQDDVEREKNRKDYTSDCVRCRCC